jgi:hypothetical protein
VARLGLLAVPASAALAAEAAVAASAHRRAGAVTTTTCGKVLPPSWGSYLGAFTDFNTRETYNEDHVSDGRITAFEESAGHTLTWV